MSNLPGGEWMSGPGVPEGELGVTPQFRVAMIEADPVAEPRHVEFCDPPGDLTPEQYEGMLREMAAEAPDLESLERAFVKAIVGDNIFAHGVEPQRAAEAAARFAARLYAEANPGR